MGFNMSHNLIRRRSEYSRYYGNMGGVDFSGDGSAIDRYRFSHLENMYRDYDGDGGGLIESVPGFRVLFSLGESVRRLYLQKSAVHGEFLLIFTKTKLYRLPIDRRDDTSAIELLGEIPEGSLTGYAHGEDFFAVCGERLYRISPEGELRRIGFDAQEIAPYVPTTYYNDSPYEQRNLLSERFKESAALFNPDSYATGSPGLLYEINSEEEGSCTLIGRSSDAPNTIFVPAKTRIGDRYYTVSRVKQEAFGADSTLEAVYFSEGMRVIEYYAFAWCPKLHTVVFSDTVEQLLGSVCVDCAALSYVHFGKGITKIGSGSFEFCPLLTKIHFAISEQDFSSRFTSDPCTKQEKQFHASNHTLHLALRIHSACKQIVRFMLDGEEHSYKAEVGEDGLIHSVTFTASDKRTLVGSTVTVEGIYADAKEGERFTPDSASDKNAPCGACVAELFDGRVFLGGAVSYPNTVFYSARDATGRSNPTYFGVYNTFDDGVGSFRVNALLSVGNTLAVFKENDDGSGSIFYHTPMETGEELVPKAYPISQVHTGLVGMGSVISYYDEPIFVSESGICALAKAKISLERSVEVRSHRINPRLLAESLGTLSLTKWCGYLVVCAGGNLYLGDYRQASSHPSGTTEYEWYYLCGVGTYTEDERVYRYTSAPSPGYLLHPNVDMRASGIVMSEADGAGEMHYFCVENGEKYELYPTEEHRGGIFHGASVVFCVDSLLFFATENGDLCLFNNDKRGAPKKGTEKEDSITGHERRLHRSYYSFGTHAPRYALYTRRDNCDIPHLAKDSVRGSLTVKCRTEQASHAKLEIGTNREGFTSGLDMQGGALDFSDMDFSAFAWCGEDYLTLAVGTHPKNFIEKQIGIYTDDFESPIAIASIAYRYTVRGKIKNK